MAEENNVACVQEQPLVSLDLYSFNRLEFLLGFTREHLRTLASSAGSEYGPYPQHKKPRPFQKAPVSRKVRIIDNPSPQLKLVQRSINKNLLRPLQYPDYLCGGIRGKSVLDNVAMHMGQRTLVTMDIRSFFPSVHNPHVYAVWNDLLGCSTRISRLLTQLTTFERHLPQGAPTSTLLANLVLFMVDSRIRTKCQNDGVIYSSWIDDLAFSGDKACDVIQTAVQALRDGGFRISRAKLKVMGPKAQKILNGIVLGRIPTVERKRLAWLRSGIHKLATGQIPPENLPQYIRSLEGKISHITRITPSKGGKLSKALVAARVQLSQMPRGTM
jgi:retron-type reverse transcriptase